MNKYLKILFAVFIVIYLLPLNLRPLIQPDETRYAQISREMIQSGDWIVPRLNNLRYFEKPVMGFWLNSLAMFLFGENGFGVRFSSAISVGLTALIIFLLSRKYFPLSKGLLPTTIYLLSVLVFLVGVFAVLDSMLSLFLTLSAASFFLAFQAESMKKRYLYLALFGASVGCSFLIKGFLAFAVTGVTAGTYLLWEFSSDKFKLLKQRSPGENIKHAVLQFLTILAPLLIIILPWSIMIHQQEPDYWRYFVMVEHIKRFMAKDAQHAQPFFYYIPVLLVGMLPWSLLLPLAISKWRSFDLKNPLVKYAFCWFLLPFLFFSICKGKLATYMLPCIPPLVILFAYGVETFLKEPNKWVKLVDVVAKLFVIILPIVIIVLLIFQITGVPGTGTDGENRFFIYENQTEWWKYCLLAFLSGFWIYFLVKTFKTPAPQKKFALFAAGLACLFIMITPVMPDVVYAPKAPGEFLTSHKNLVKPDTILASDHSMSRAVCWYFNRKDVYIVLNANELSYGINYDDESKKRFLNDPDFRVFAEKHKGNLVLIMARKHYKEYVLENNYFPEPEKVIAKGKFAILEY